MEITELTVVKVTPGAVPHVQERLREFESDRGVKVAQVFPKYVYGETDSLIVYVLAKSQEALHWFLSIIGSYSEVRAIRPYRSST